MKGGSIPFDLTIVSCGVVLLSVSELRRFALVETVSDSISTRISTRLMEVEW